MGAETRGFGAEFHFKGILAFQGVLSLFCVGHIDRDKGRPTMRAEYPVSIR